MEELTRICKKCGKEKSIDEFYTQIQKHTGREYRHRLCRTCIYQRNMINRRNLQLQQCHGINEAQYNLILRSQNEVCAICGQPETCKGSNKMIKSLSVDHNHKTHKIRGLLCSNCNRAIGLLKDDPEILRKAIKYLEK